jgi:hypothetical protein
MPLLTLVRPHTPAGELDASLVPSGPGGLLLWADVPPDHRMRVEHVWYGREYIVVARYRDAAHLCSAAVHATATSYSDLYLQCGSRVSKPDTLCERHQLRAEGQVSAKPPKTAWDNLDPWRPLIDQVLLANAAPPHSNSSDVLEAKLRGVLSGVREQLVRTLKAG